jgi:hypothetical protein
MALEGRIKDFGLSDIFQLIHLQKKTGTLTVKDDQQKSVILFEEGMVVGAETNDRKPGDRLGELLIKVEKLSNAQLNEALKLQQQHDEKFGKILEEKGWIKKDELIKMLQLQIQESIYRLFIWKEGQYAFEQKKVEYDHEYTNPINTEFILMEGVRRIDEWPLIQKIIPSVDVVFEACPQDKSKIVVKAQSEDDGGKILEDSAKTGDTITLTQAEFQILDLVDGMKDIRTIIDFSQRGEFETCKLLATLLQSGLIAVKETKSQDTPKTMAAIEATSKLIVGTAKQTVRYAFYLLSVFMLIGFGFLVYQYQDNIQSSLNSIVGSSYATRPVQARLELGRVRTILMMYFLEHHVYPPDLNQLVKDRYLSSEALQDPWGHPLHYDRFESSYKLNSSGVDGILGTPDDID